MNFSKANVFTMRRSHDYYSRLLVLSVRTINSTTDPIFRAQRYQARVIPRSQLTAQPATAHKNGRS